MTSITTTDGVKLSYEVIGRENDPVLLLIHGWSGSGRYFTLNTSDLAKQGIRVLTVDLRFHGDSDKSDFGYHIARLAADVHELLQQLRLCDVHLLGTSMVCLHNICNLVKAPTYIESFDIKPRMPGDPAVHSLTSMCTIIASTAPLQNLTHDWKLGSKGCYDIASLTRMQCALEQDFPAFAQGGCAACASLPIASDVRDLLVSETLKCNPTHLAKLMADHTQLDWRPILPQISVPCLNLIGCKSGIFPPEGCAEVGRLIERCTSVYFSDANHWLYLEEPEIFNALVGAFVLSADVPSIIARFPGRVSMEEDQKC